MKTLVWSTSMLATTLEERRAQRPFGRNAEAFQAMLQKYERIAKAADELGFEAFGSAEHHFQAEGGETLPNALLLYAKLAALTERITFVPLSVILTAHNPLRVAEDLALFGHMYPGRLGVGFGRGYQSRWVQTLAQDVDIVSNNPASDGRNREIFDEYLGVVERAWAEDSFRFDGKYFQVPFPAAGIPGWPPADFTRTYGGPQYVDDDATVREIGVVPKPLSRPTIFIPSVGAGQTVLDSARNGRVLLSHGVAPEQVRDLARRYREAAREVGRDLALGEGLGLVVKLFFGETFDEAFELAVRTAGFWYHHLLGPFGFNEPLREEGDTPGFPLTLADARDLTRRMVDKGVLFCGTEDQIQERVAELHSATGDRLEWLVWEFWSQALGGDEAPEVQRHQLEAYARSVGQSLR